MEKEKYTVQVIDYSKSVSAVESKQMEEKQLISSLDDKTAHYKIWIIKGIQRQENKSRVFSHTMLPKPAQFPTLAQFQGQQQRQQATEAMRFMEVGLHQYSQIVELNQTRESLIKLNHQLSTQLKDQDQTVLSMMSKCKEYQQIIVNSIARLDRATQQLSLADQQRQTIALQYYTITDWLEKMRSQEESLVLSLVFQQHNQNLNDSINRYLQATKGPFESQEVFHRTILGIFDRQQQETLFSPDRISFEQLTNRVRQVFRKYMTLKFTQFRQIISHFRQ